MSADDQPRVLSYLDLRASSPHWRLPTVVESNGRPCVHVFDARNGVTQDQIGHWCWRVALRGDGAWIGILEPRALRVFRADVSKNTIDPVEVAAVSRGEWALPQFLSDVSAGQNDIARRRYLTKLLDSSARAATALGLSQLDALSLVGRGLFWRFLVDRNLLAGIAPREVSDTAETWEQCLDNKARALRTFNWLDKTFNGGLLPFEANPKTFDPTVFSNVLGNIAHGATETGQLRLPSDWQEVNFSYVPVGLLSEVYEAFAHNIDAADASKKSIHYTPSHLASFIVGQALEGLIEDDCPRLLDPAAGAGVFLVTALRKLVEREWQITKRRPLRRRIRDILNKQLVGFDVDGRALRLAELALYLTALELDPKPKPLNELKFDALRESVLFDLSENPHGSLGPLDRRFQRKFDIVIGNPPWTAKAQGITEKQVWVDHSRGVVRERLGKAREAAFDLPDTNVDLPFVWRAMAWAKCGGRIALVTHARWLFGLSERAVRARNDLIEAVRVTGILNGAGLRRTRVWPEIDAPWCVLFATNEPPLHEDQDSYAFQFVSLALDAYPDSLQTRIRIDWFDSYTVSATEVLECPWAFKIRFRGNRLAASALRSMRQTGIDLGRYLKRLDLEFSNGYQIGGNARKEKQQSSIHMKGMPNTKDAGQLGFVIDADDLPIFDRDQLLSPRDPKIYRAPLLLVAKSISADRLAVRVSRASDDVAYHESYHGLSFARLKDSDLLARYLQLWLQSSVMVFCELLTDGQYGVERDAIYQESLSYLPIVPLEDLSNEQKRKVIAISKRLNGALSQALADEIDNFVFDTFDLSDVGRQAIRDTLATALPSTGAKRRATGFLPDIERERFIQVLRESLNDVLSASDVRAEVQERTDLHWKPWRVLEVRIGSDELAATTNLPIDAFLREAEMNGASLVTVNDGAIWHVGILDRHAWWTSTRARLLATDLLAARPTP
ncbi:MAG: N-6 DNA methylase [Sulfuritalea sp.]|nr:N-6 DNA methylase [Sulfuritalea sp.]